MATGTNRWKLGLFVLAGIALALVGLIALGAHDWSHSSVGYVSYFDESVQGLEIGSPVKFRGVSVGRVSAIAIAPDQRHIEVHTEIEGAHLAQLRPAARPGEHGEHGESLGAAHPDLRAQLTQAGIAGSKFILLDYFDPQTNPAPELPFPVPRNYLPATPSVLENLEHSVLRSADRFPDLTADAQHALHSLDEILQEVDRQRVPERAAEALDRASQALHVFERQLAAADAPALSREARRALQTFEASLGRADQLMDRIDGEGGLIAGAQRSVDALGDAARGARSLGDQLELTLRDVRGAARSLRRFTDALERDPDMLLKGRAAGDR
ncbi:MAG TPA: MlaD family protein [Polyangiaceae bacterium]|nr:MlaD family protein [Polyangiaceae bacterium]